MSLLNATIEVHEQGDYVAAEAGYWDVLRDNLDNPEALYLNALVAYQTGRYELGLALSKHLLSLQPEHHLGLALQIKLFMAIQDFTEALSVSIQHSNIIWDLPEHYLLKAECYQSLHDFLNAQKTLKAYRNRFGLSLEVAFAFGQLYFKAQKFHYGQRYFKALLTHDPTHHEARLFVGKCYEQLQQHHDAIQEFNVILSANSPVDKSITKAALNHMAICLHAIGQPQMARDCQHMSLSL